MKKFRLPKRKRKAKLYSSSDILGELCMYRKQWGIYLSINTPYDEKDLQDPPTNYSWMDETIKAAPYMSLTNSYYEILINNGGYVFFNTKKEMEEIFWLTVGDDGPTKTNPYNGPGNVFALTCDPNGQTLNENT